MQWYYHKMVVVCQQPNFFPWLGYFEQCARAETLVLLDSVQWIRTGLHNRARAFRRDSYEWLTIPVHSHGHRDKTIADIEIAGPWAEKHWRSLMALYGRRPFFKTQLEPNVRPWLERVAGERRLVDVSRSSLDLCFALLGIAPKVVVSSTFEHDGAKTDRLISLCRAVGATTYYSGIASTRYVDVSAFRAAGIRLLWQHWRHPDYEQGHARFVSHLSFFDVLANVKLDLVKKWLEPNPYGPFGPQKNGDLEISREPDRSL